MPKAKKSTKTKTTTKKVEKKIEEPKIPQMYVIDIWDRVYHSRTTISKDIDTFRGSIAYSESRDKLINLNPRDGACEGFINHSFTVNNISYSPTEQPKEWIMNVHKGVIDRKSIASDVSIYYESEVELPKEVLISLGEASAHTVSFPSIV